MTEETSEDERDIELTSIQAIFPELEITTGEPRRALLDLEIAPSNKLVVTFDDPIPLPTFHLPSTPASEHSEDQQRDQSIAVKIADRHDLEYLPSLHLEICLSASYPEHQPPNFELTSEPAWLPGDLLQRLQQEGNALWEEYGHSQVVFAFIDFLQQEAEQAFGIPQTGLRLPHVLKDQLLEFNQRAKRQKFEQETFDCGVCLEPKKGSSCYRLHQCGHVFCTACLQDFYNAAIAEGDVANVKCLAPDCGKDKKAKKQHTLHPRELLEIPLERSEVQRYIDIKLKKKLESDKTTIFCPRNFCQAPARSAKYAKYNSADLESYPMSDDEDEEVIAEIAPPVNGAPRLQAHVFRLPEDRLSICSKCAYAFCRTCLKSWHGDLMNCRPPKSELAALSAEELASYDYIRLHTSPCPTCNSPSQKTHGCNHMICYQCNTHFCYLCSSWLDSANPYLHFNRAGTGCFMRLWELEEGDEGADGDHRPAAFAGPRGAEQAAIFAAMFEDDEGHALGEAQGHEQGQARAQRLQQQPAPRPAQAAGAPGIRIPGRRRGHVDPGLQRFLQMAANDEEDGWDSDEMEDFGAAGGFR